MKSALFTLFALYGLFLSSRVSACSDRRCALLTLENVDLAIANTILLEANSQCHQSISCIAQQVQFQKIARAQIVNYYVDSYYDNAVAIVAGKKNVTARVHPNATFTIYTLADFQGASGVIEYEAGLSNRPQKWCSNTGPGGSLECGLAYYLSGRLLDDFFMCNGTKCSFRWEFSFFYANITANGTVLSVGNLAAKIKEEGWILFDCDGLILGAELNVPLLDELTKWTHGDAVTSVQLATAACTIYMNNCAARFNYYANYTDCFNYISSLPVGNFAEFGRQNSSRCRAFHANLASNGVVHMADGSILDYEADHCGHLAKDSIPCVEAPLMDYFKPNSTNELTMQPLSQYNQACNDPWKECYDDIYTQIYGY
jgi:hypothetical protein